MAADLARVRPRPGAASPARPLAGRPPSPGARAIQVEVRDATAGCWPTTSRPSPPGRPATRQGRPRPSAAAQSRRPSVSPGTLESWLAVETTSAQRLARSRWHLESPGGPVLGALARAGERIRLLASAPTASHGTDPRSSNGGPSRWPGGGRAPRRRRDGPARRSVTPQLRTDAETAEGRRPGALGRAGFERREDDRSRRWTRRLATVVTRPVCPRAGPQRLQVAETRACSRRAGRGRGEREGQI